ncbi:MAG: hypothetical protein KGS44_13240 [Alphaproteobacteria bacterium]|nr:hypothetical protein [Alphaproteobacteria bacterium]
MDTLHTPAASKDQIEAADGYVVCLIWTQARIRSCAFAYEHYERLADAVAAYRKPGRDFAAHGIFASKDGLPIGPALDVATILSVQPGEKRAYGLREWSPVTPEHMTLRERARFWEGR